MSAKQYLIQRLEPRRLLSNVTINATSGADTIAIHYEYSSFQYREIVSVNGNPQSPVFSPNTVTINALGGADTINIQSTTVPTTINGGDGDDLFSFGTDSANGTFLGYLLAPVLIQPDAGNDAVAFNDSANATPNFGNSFDVEATQVTYGRFGDNQPVSFGPAASELPESLSIVGSTADASYFIAGQPAGSMAILAGSGNDSFEVYFHSTESATSILGGAGNNTMTIFDDDSGSGRSYTLTSSSLAVNSTVMGLSQFGDVTLHTLPDATVMLNSFAGTDLTVHAETHTSTGHSTVTVGDGDLSHLSGTISVIASLTSIATINDATRSTGQSYTLANFAGADNYSTLTTSSTSASITIVDATTTLKTGLGNDSVTLSQITALPAAVDAGGGNDVITLGGGNLRTGLLFPVTVNGGSGTDQLFFANSAVATAESQSLDAGTFTDNQVYSFSAVESLFIDEGPGGETINLNMVQVPVTVQGRGNDIVNIGAGDLTDNWLANVSILGNFGSDILTIDDHLGLNGSATYQWDTGDQFHASNIFREPTLGTQTITATTVASRVLLANAAPDIINVNSTSTGLSLFANGGNDQVNVFDSDGPVGVDTGSDGLSLIFPFGDYLNVNTDAGTSGDSGASVKLLNGDDIYSVAVNAATNTIGTLQLPTGTTLNITHDLALTGVIDMAGGAMALANGASQISQFSTWIKNGRSSNTWTGTGSGAGAINSSLAAATPNSTAVGFAPASAVFSNFPVNFFGKSVFAPTMLVRYTTLGDATLSAKTNALDFNALASNFGKPSANWYQGDFNYDGFVNTPDFTLLSQHFNTAVAAPPVPDAIASIRPDLFSAKQIQPDLAYLA